MSSGDFSFIVAPIHQGQKHKGVADGPAFLRRRLIDQKLDFNSVVLCPVQDSKVINLNPYRDLSFLVERELQSKSLVFTAGGDHSLSLGSIQGALRVNPELKVLWIDAHGDVNTRATSVTGAFHGMPLAFLLGADNFDQPSWFKNFLRPENLIYFGVRDLDPAESGYLADQSISCYTTKHIQVMGVDRVIRHIANDLSGSQVLISVDADAFDPTVAPSTGVPVPQGLHFNHVASLISAVAEAAQVVSFEYVELNPDMAQKPQDNERTAQLGIDLFKIILEKYRYEAGGIYGGYDRQLYSKKSDLFYPHR